MLSACQRGLFRMLSRLFKYFSVYGFANRDVVPINSGNVFARYAINAAEIDGVVDKRLHFIPCRKKRLAGELFQASGQSIRPQFETEAKINVSTGTTHGSMGSVA